MKKMFLAASLSAALVWGVAANAAIVTDQNQATNNTYMVGFFQSDIAQTLFDSNGRKFRD